MRVPQQQQRRVLFFPSFQLDVDDELDTYVPCRSIGRSSAKLFDYIQPRASANSAAVASVPRQRSPRLNPPPPAPPPVADLARPPAPPPAATPASLPEAPPAGPAMHPLRATPTRTRARATRNWTRTRRRWMPLPRAPLPVACRRPGSTPRPLTCSAAPWSFSRPPVLSRH